MQTKPKANSILTHEVRGDGALVIHVKGCEDVVFRRTLASTVTRDRAEYHGWVQRLCDGAAKARNTADGKPAPASEKRAAIQRLADHYETGTESWNLVREGGGGGGPGLDTTILAAVSEATGRDLGAVRAMVAEGATKRGMKPADYLAQLATAKAVAPVLERMRAAQATVNADEELDAMMAEGDEDDDGPGFGQAEADAMAPDEVQVAVEAVLRDGDAAD